jgi:hypothetical protein
MAMETVDGIRTSADGVEADYRMQALRALQRLAVGSGGINAAGSA